jgi:hypothetical protein
MESLSARELLRAWEQGHSRRPAEQALLLLGAARPDLGHEALWSLTIGERDRLLFRLREQMFGSSLDAVAVCPECGDRVEFAFRTADVIRNPLNSQAEPLDFQLNGYAFKARLLTCSDLADAAVLQELAAARDFLIERSIISVERDGQPVSFSELPPHAIDFISEHMAEADAFANIQLQVTCAACTHTWNEVLNITTFLWTEIEGWAYRTLHEVHRLASEYGWRESEILGMTAWRRHCYLRLIGK